MIPHGVDTDLYAPPADRASAFAQGGLPGRYAIGCFGRVRAQKGSDVFVEAMCRLLPRFPDFTAVMVGAITPEQSGFASDLKGRIEAAGLQSRILIMGELPIEEVQRWYQRLTIYVFSSRNEGFGLTLIEAMAAGAALVASRAGAAELVVEDGVSGVLTPPGDVEALVRGAGAADARSRLGGGDGRAGKGPGSGEIQSRCEAGRIAEVYRARWSEHAAFATNASRSPPENRNPGKPAASAASISLGRSPMTKLPSRRTGQCSHQIVDHAGARLSPVMIFEIAFDRSVGMMRAISDIVDPRALRGEFGAHPVVQNAQIVLGEESARDARLIGEKEHKISGFVESADRLRRVRHPANSLPCPHIAVVVIDDAVAVEESSGPERGARGIGAAHSGAPSRIMVCSISSQMA